MSSQPVHDANLVAPSPASLNKQQQQHKVPSATTPNPQKRNTHSDNFELETTHPLMDAEKVHPPLANPEVDEENDDRENVNKPYPGVDDGFFISTRANEDPPDVENVPKETPPEHPKAPKPHRPQHPDFVGSERPFPAYPDLEFGTIAPDLESIPDVNLYQHKKTLAQGMMDLALFSANANQLRYVLDSSSHPYYYSGIVLISISLIFQVAVGVGLIWNARYNVRDEKEICIANKINNFTIIGIFLVTVVNVFISAFGVASVQPIVVKTGST